MMGWSAYRVLLPLQPGLLRRGRPGRGTGRSCASSFAGSSRSRARRARLARQARRLLLPGCLVHELLGVLAHRVGHLVQQHGPHHVCAEPACKLHLYTACSSSVMSSQVRSSLCNMKRAASCKDS